MILSKILCFGVIGIQQHSVTQVKGVGIEGQIFCGGLVWYPLGNQFGFPGGAGAKNLPANAGDTRDTGLIPGFRIFPGGGTGNLLHYS